MTLPQREGEREVERDQSEKMSHEMGTDVSTGGFILHGSQTMLSSYGGIVVINILFSLYWVFGLVTATLNPKPDHIASSSQAQ